MEDSNKFLLTIAYEGSSFAGWQTQFNGQAIQSLIEDKLAILLKHPIKLVGSGRTDSGVHALAQTAHFESNQVKEPQNLLHRLNCLLPSSIRILSIKAVSLDFHARYSVQRKTYQYRIYNSAVMDPFELQRAWHLTYPLNHAKMLSATQKLIGSHDFKAFAAKNTLGAASLDSVRHLEQFTFVKVGPLLIFELTAKGFLYKMVRNLVGCVIEIGMGKLDIEVIDQAFLNKQRHLVGATAPPHGLYLKEVYYF